MALSSLSSRADVLTAYADNAAYEENESVSQCKAFITACRLLLSPRFSVKRVSHGGRGAEEVELDLNVIQEERKAAQNWLAANPVTTDGSGSSSVVHPDFTNFRD